MQPALLSSQPIMRRLVTLGVMGILLVGALAGLSVQTNPYAPEQAPPSNKPPIMNAELLMNWLPPKSYAYTVARIDDYLAANSISPSSLEISKSVATDHPTYHFILTAQPQDSALDVQVIITNFASILNTAVAINGQVQNPQTATSAISFTGLGKLNDIGMSIAQTNNLQAAFEQFAPSASTITLDTTAAGHSIDQATGANTFTFAVDIDGTGYKAQVICPDLSAAQLKLLDTHTGKTVFDSGVVNTAS